MKVKPCIVLFNERGKAKEFLNYLATHLKKEYNISSFNSFRPIVYRLEDNLFLLRMVKPLKIAYRIYDNLLLGLSQEGYNSLNGKGIIVGHFDNDGFLWTDYESFKEYK